MATVSDFVVVLDHNAETEELGSGFSPGLAVLSFCLLGVAGIRCSSMERVGSPKEGGGQDRWESCRVR